ncbi:hypothetical protein [Listeria valentina]|uniref:hypothetical protein n=1 Tax=Listeria valentina TaxID=2705293 RepID=UPI00142FA774|nr:hypothetical protein [Listeria valentina]
MSNQDRNLEEKRMEFEDEEKKLKKELHILKWEFDQFSSLKEMLLAGNFTSASDSSLEDAFEAPRTKILASRIDETYQKQQIVSSEQIEKYLSTFLGQLTAEKALVGKRLLQVQMEKEQF